MRRSFQVASVCWAAALLTALVASPALAVHLANPNRVVDPGFEGTITTDGPPFVGLWEGFTAGAPTTGFTTTMPRNGSQSLDLSITNEANVFAGAFQDVPFAASLAGKQAWFSGWHKLIGDSGGSEIRIEWRNSVSNSEVSRTQITDSPAGSDYEEFIIADTIPAGVDTARLVYAIQSFGGALTQQVFVDDVNFNYVPEPASASLAALFGLMLAGVRRRR
jgi:hypothetical protein